MQELTLTIKQIIEHKGTEAQEVAKKEFLKAICDGCPKNRTAFEQMMLLAFIAGRAFEANR